MFLLLSILIHQSLSLFFFSFFLSFPSLFPFCFLSFLSPSHFVCASVETNLLPWPNPPTKSPVSLLLSSPPATLSLCLFVPFLKLNPSFHSFIPRQTETERERESSPQPIPSIWSTPKIYTKTKPPPTCPHLINKKEQNKVKTTINYIQATKEKQRINQNEQNLMTISRSLSLAHFS